MTARMPVFNGVDGVLSGGLSQNEVCTGTGRTNRDYSVTIFS